MKLIYQVGRFDNPKSAFQNFVIKDFFGETVNFQKTSELSSFVLRDFLLERGGEAKVVVVYPVSIILNEKLKDFVEDDDLKKELAYILENPVPFLKNPFEIFEKIPLEGSKDHKLIVHSLGMYLGGRVELYGKYEDIVLEILFDMIERYLSEDIEEIYIDISSGHNIYISAMLEAVRNFAVFTKLMHWIHKEKQPKVFITFSDPIIGRSEKLHQIHIQMQNFAAFFSSPISKREAVDLNFSFLRNIYKEPNISQKGNGAVILKQEVRKKRKGLKEKIELFTILFSAIKNNVPLYLYYHPYHSLEEIKQELVNLIEHAKSDLIKDFEKSPQLDKKAYLDVILSLGFYMGIVEVLERYNVTMFCEEDGLDINELKRVFAEIYSIFELPMNIIMLGNEVSNDTEKIEKVGEIPQWTRLRKIVDPTKPILDEADERNFFAHSGLEGNVTEVKYDGQSIRIRYIHALCKPTIDCWLKERI